MGIGYKSKKLMKVLSNNEVERVHEGTLEVLKDCGVRFEDEEALKILGEAGCQVDRDRMMVKFPVKIVEESLKKKPDTFYLKGRNPKYDLKFSGEEVYFTNHACSQIVDWNTGKPKIATLDDVTRMITIIDALENYHACFETAAILADKPIEVTREWIRAETFRNTEKSATAGSLKGTRKWLIRMAEVVGETMQACTCSSSPLVCGEDMCRAIIEYGRAGHPLSIQSGAAMGATCPATIAGTLVLHNAEVLAGMVLAQLANPGIGMFYGSETMPMDMRTGRLASGAVEVGILTAAIAQMADFYGVPCRAVFPMTDANSPDQQCGYEKAVQLVLMVLAGVNYNISGGGLEDEVLVSFEQLVIDNEMYGMMGRLLEGIKVDEDSLSVNLIKEVGPVPGSFLNKKHTSDFWEKEHYIPRLSARMSYARWERGGAKDIVKVAREKVMEIWKTHKPVPLPEEVDRELAKILEAAAKEKLGN
jgi:trimethylamine--corrinoid protein Co-methyltransferase